MRTLLLISTFWLTSVGLLAADDELHSWKSLSGKEMKASFVRLDGSGQVILRSAAGKEKAFDVSMFAPESRRLINHLEAVAMKDAEPAVIEEGEEVQFSRPVFVAGKTYKQEALASVVVTQGGEETKTDVSLEVSVHVVRDEQTGSIEAIAKTDRVNTIISGPQGEVSVDSDKVSEIQNPGQRQQIQALRDSVARFQMESAGKVGEATFVDSLTEDGALAKETLKDYGPGILRIMPERSVKLGDSWEFTEKVPNAAVGSMTIWRKMTYLRNEVIGGHDCAVVSVDGEIKEVENPSIQLIDPELTGRILVDRKLGYVVSFESGLTFELQVGLEKVKMVMTADLRTVDVEDTDPAELAQAKLVETVVKEMKEQGAPATLEEALVASAEATRRGLPIKVDEETTFLDVRAGPGLKFTYIYSLSVDVEDLDIAQFAAAMRPSLEQAYQSDVMTRFREGKVQVVYRYLDQSNKPITDVVINPKP